MFPQLQNALNKLRESKQPHQPHQNQQNNPSPTKRVSTATKDSPGQNVDTRINLPTVSRSTTSKGIHNNNNNGNDGDTFDDFDFDLYDDEEFLAELNDIENIPRDTTPPTKNQSLVQAATSTPTNNNNSSSSSNNGNSTEQRIQDTSSQFLTPQQQPQHMSQHGGSEGRCIGRENGTQVQQITTMVERRARRLIPLSQGENVQIPGPAGLLEESSNSNEVDLASTQRPVSAPFKTPFTRHKRHENQSDADFEGGTWAALLDYLHLPPYKPSTAKQITESAEPAGWPISKVSESLQTVKVRIMLVQIREVHMSDTDAAVIFIDPTGEIRASVHRPVMRRYAQFLVAGTSLILKNVVVMKMPNAHPFLVVTDAMIEQIFAAKSERNDEDPITIESTRSSADTPSRLPRRPVSDLGLCETRMLGTQRIQPNQHEDRNMNRDSGDNLQRPVEQDSDSRGSQSSNNINTRNNSSTQDNEANISCADKLDYELDFDGIDAFDDLLD